MSTDEYVPSEDDARSVWVVHERDCGWEPHPGDPSAEFDHFIAKVKRTAAREALDGLAEDRRTVARMTYGHDAESWEPDVIYAYRDRHYPEETP